MKLESLIIVFLLIIIPISMVLSEYVDKRIEAEKREISYNTKLFNSTHDAIKEYQLRTVGNEFSDIISSKIIDIESAVNTFFISLGSNLGYSGYNTEAIKEYVPAVAFTLYDGYYIYSPYRNTLTEVEKGKEGSEIEPEKYDPDYSKDGVNYYGLKPYVYYSCRYNVDPGNNFVITYTLDNYITIQGVINNNYVYDCGYLYAINSDDGITKNGEVYKYNNVEFKEGDTEELQEYGVKVDSVEDKMYSYVKINGKKYYLKKGTNKEAEIFYIEKSGARNYSQFNAHDDKTQAAYDAITKNKSAYEYYKNAYEFSNRIYNDYHLGNLKSSDADFYNENDNGSIKLNEFGDFKIFAGTPQYEGSNFNKHRKSIIRYVVENNLLAAITSYASNSVDEFLMPKISDSDWDLIENNVCALSFMQGINIGSKKYNGYSVVPNTLTKEYVDEDDIYIVSGNTYYRVNDNSLYSPLTKVKLNASGSGFYAGILKLDFEQKRVLNDTKQTVYYYPQHLLGSYTSIFGSAGINHIKKDMYQYVKEETNDKIREIYYKALGRERWSSFNINNVNFEKSNDSLYYFLKDYYEN